VAAGPDARRGLYRLRVNPSDVYASGIEAGAWWQDFWQPRRTGLDAPLNLLAQAAVFRCEAVVEEIATGIVHRVPLDRTVRAGAEGVMITPALGAVPAHGLRLTALELTLVILRPEGETMLRDHQSLTVWRRFGDTFSKRIIF